MGMLLLCPAVVTAPHLWHQWLFRGSLVAGSSRVEWPWKFESLPWTTRLLWEPTSLASVSFKVTLPVGALWKGGFRCTATVQGSWAVSKAIEHILGDDPEIPLLGIYSREMKTTI